MAKRTVVITCGPSYEPVDGMRRLTNASTGALGHALAEGFHQAGWPVLLLVGTGATYQGNLGAATPKRHFGTNDDLLRMLQEIAVQEVVAAVLMAAALCDFRVAAVQNLHGETLTAAKHSSRQGALTLALEPAAKVLPQLRRLFPQSKLVGWKYELDGPREAVLTKGRTQLAECQTDACVVNGAGFGEGFGVLQVSQEKLVQLPSLDELVKWAVQWMEET